MIKPCVKNERSKQILSLLKINALIPLSAIQLLLEPKIQPRRLRDAISRLKKRKLIEVRKIRFTGEDLHYYQINQTPEAFTYVSNLLGCSETDLDTSYFHHRDFLHNDGVSLLAFKLLKLFPAAEIIRDFSIQNNEEATKIMQYNWLSEDLKPDLLLKLPHANNKTSVWIAFELEKSRKKDRLIIRKLRKYAAKSHVDGVVYYCDSRGVKNAITTNYASYVANWARRVWSYKNNFILLGDSSLIVSGAIENLHRLDNKSASLVEWISTFCVTPKNDLNDNLFKIPAAYG